MGGTHGYNFLAGGYFTKKKFDILEQFQILTFILFIVYLIFNIFTKLDSPGLMDDVNLIKSYPLFYGEFSEFIRIQIEDWSGFFIL